MRTLLSRPGVATAEFLRGARRDYVTPIQAFLVANVLRQEQRRACACAVDFVSDLASLGLVDVGQDDPCAFARERDGIGPAETGRTARDDGHLAVESRHDLDPPEL